MDNHLWRTTRPSLLTYGIELEFLVQFMFEGDPDIYASTDLPSVTRIPLSLENEISKMIRPRHELYNHRDIAAYVKSLIRKCLKDAGLPVETGEGRPILRETYPGLENLSKRRLLGFEKWCVKTDSTVHNNKSVADGYGYVPIEITTPSMTGTEQSFKVVRYIVNLLASEYRVIVNPTCGMHVHVGNGVTGFDKTNIQRIAGLFYSADRLLATLHPPYRRFNKWALSVRDRSEVAIGKMTAESENKIIDGAPGCHHFVGQEVRHGERPFAWREMNDTEEIRQKFLRTRNVGCFEPFLWKEDDHTVSSFSSNVSPSPRLVTNNSDGEERSHQSSAMWTSSTGSDESDVSIQRNKGVWDDTNSTDSDTKSLFSSGTSECSSDVEVTKHQTTKIEIRRGQYVPCRPRRIPRIAPPSYTPEQKRKFHLQAEHGRKHTELIDEAKTDLGTFHGLREIFSATSSCVVQRLLMSSDRPNYNLEKYACYNLTAPDEMAPTVEFREAAGSMDARWVETWARIAHGLTSWAIHASVDEYLKVVVHCEQGSRGEIEYDVVDLLDETCLFSESQVAEERIRDNLEEWELSYVLQD